MDNVKIYEGIRETRTVRYNTRDGGRTPIYQNQQFLATVNNQPLNPRFDVIGYSTSEAEPFEWGCRGGRGEYQLAVAILTDAYGPDVAKRCVTQFAREVVRKLRDDWTLTEGEVFAYVLSIEMETRDAPAYVEPAAPSLPYQPTSATLAGCGLPPMLPARKRRTRKKQAPISSTTIPLAVAV